MELLRVSNLKVSFPGRGRGSEVKAVNGVSFGVSRGGIVGLVGESGCGKSTVGNAITGMVPVQSGRIEFEGRRVDSLRRAETKAFRRRVQMIFQDPFGSLNPRMSIGDCVGEVLKVHGIVSPSERGDRIRELLSSVGLDPLYASRYPHEFSGGQRQRIGIARALAVNPELVIADEPVSALDVSVQVQILNLMRDLRERLNLSYILIAHDLAVVRNMCDTVLVMYLGRIVESGRAGELFDNCAHPYTEALLSAVPDVEKGLRAKRRGSERIVLRGDVPSPEKDISGCPFHPRCHRAREVCSGVVPPVRVLDPGHFSECHFAEEVAGCARKKD